LAVLATTDAGRCVVVALRAPTDWAELEFVAVCRLTLDASRTAALATPMPTYANAAKSKNLFIISCNNIKKPQSGQLIFVIFDPFFHG